MDSLRNQIYSNLEVIFVDDCGTDCSVSKISDYISDYNLKNWEILYHKKNKGLSGARNTGMLAATGDYVYFLDSDDYITNDCIQSLVAPIKAETYDMVVGDYQNSINIGDSMLHHDTGVIAGAINVLKTYSQGEWYVMAWNKLCNRKFLVENNLFFEEGLLHEDVIWTFKVACKAQSIYIVNNPTYIYNIRQSSIMTSMSIEKDVSIYCKVFDCIIDFVKREKRIYGKYEYTIIEGKKSGIMYSLLEKGENELYNKFYPTFYSQCYISPLMAYKRGMISMGYFLRDLHYMLPMKLGQLYKKCFYLLCYKFRNKKIVGAVWC